MAYACRICAKLNNFPPLSIFTFSAERILGEKNGDKSEGSAERRWIMKEIM